MPQQGGRGTWKQAVFGVFERGGRVYTELIPDAKQLTLRKLIRGKINLTSILYSDGWRGYNGLLDMGYNKHFRINKSKSFWRFTKRRLSKFNEVKFTFELHLKRVCMEMEKINSGNGKRIMENGKKKVIDKTEKLMGVFSGLTIQNYHYFCFNFKIFWSRS